MRRLGIESAAFLFHLIVFEDDGDGGVSALIVVGRLRAPDNGTRLVVGTGRLTKNGLHFGLGHIGLDLVEIGLGQDGQRSHGSDWRGW